MITIMVAGGGSAGCASEDDCETSDAGPADAGPDACAEEDDDVARAADDALEPTHVIDHIEDLF